MLNNSCNNFLLHSPHLTHDGFVLYITSRENFQISNKFNFFTFLMAAMVRPIYQDVAN
jgi:hypothetical protein